MSYWAEPCYRASVNGVLEAPVKVILLLPVFLFSLFYLQLLDYCSYGKFLHLSLFADLFLVECFFNFEDFIAHPSKEELGLLLNPQSRR